MKHINILDSETINKIAAGEVVERPSSVVKELVENSIDARATAITVEIKDGGTTFIRVTDNGSGIDRDDIDTAFLRHATSKIKSAVDLVTIGSLGFRGEALSSIVAVSQVELITKTHPDLLGVRYCVDGGVVKVKEDIGSPDGTTIIVRNLFYNTPARKKFLKTAQTEAGYITELVNKLALSRPDISFKLIVNDRNKLHTSGNTNLKDVIYQIYGRDLTAHLLKVDAVTPLMHVTGFIGKPIVSRGTRSLENYFINRRYIKSNIITKAIEDAYKTFVMVHKFPFTCIHFEFEQELLDVNVHPRKMELKFTQSEEVYQQVYDVVRSILCNRSLVPTVTLVKESEDLPEKPVKPDSPEPFELQRLASIGGKKNEFEPKQFRSEYHSGGSSSGRSSGIDHSYEKYKARYGGKTEEKQAEPLKDNGSFLIKDTASSYNSEKKQAEIRPSNTAPSVTAPHTGKAETSGSGLQMKAPEAPAAPKPLYKDAKQLELFDGDLLSQKDKFTHRLIGQVFDTYWLVEYDNRLFIIDQHAAHEKILYERLVKAFKKKAENSQLISPAKVVRLTPQEAEIYTKYEDYFREIGFDIAYFGGKEYIINAVPLQLFNFEPADLFMEVLAALSDETKNIEGSAITYKIATMACKAAVKGGNRLSFTEADELIKELLAAENPYTCPHGRPTIISLSKYEMEKKFKRIQDKPFDGVQDNYE